MTVKKLKKHDVCKKEKEDEELGFLKKYFT
jgi:hypothetical protein